MTIIYKGYPRALKTKQLVEVIDEYANEINNSGADINKVMQYAPYISLGINELQSRQSTRVTRISLAISLLSLFIAGLALHVSNENTHASSRWEENQIQLFQKIDTKISNTHNSTNLKNKNNINIKKSKLSDSIKEIDSSSNTTKITPTVENKKANKKTNPDKQ